MPNVKTIAVVSVGALLAASSVVAVAGTSPFASKKAKAWETQPAPTSSQGEAQGGAQYAAPNSTKQNYNAPRTFTAPTATAPAMTYQAPTSQYQAPIAGANAQMPSGNYNPAVGASGSYYPGKQPAASELEPEWAQRNYAPASSAPQQNQQGGYYNQGVYAQPSAQYQAQAQDQVQTRAPYSAPTGLRGASKPSWKQRLGFGNLETNISGFAKAGVAVVEHNGSVVAESIVDINVRAEVSAITEGGLEYGAGARARVQRDRRRRGFGGRVGDCPATNPACGAALVGTDMRSIKGHTGQFYTGGPYDDKETELALEGAYLFLRSSYGDFVVGRDDGAAYLFSLGAPSLLAVGASNSGTDYTGLDSVKTYNDASGFAEKISYTTPRLLGDTVGVGVQMGFSYAPSTKACGVNYCVRDNGAGAGDVFSPEIKDVLEAGLSLDRKFSNGLGVEFTGTYARGSEKTGNAAFTDLSTWGAGLELKYSNFVFGTSYLNSNNAVAGNGDYKAYDVGLTWQPSKWGVSASYGHAIDDLAQLSSDQGVFGVSYDFSAFRLGTGIQYVNRKTPFDTGTGIELRSEDSTALFIEAGVDF